MPDALLSQRARFEIATDAPKIVPLSPLLHRDCFPVVLEVDEWMKLSGATSVPGLAPLLFEIRRDHGWRALVELCAVCRCYRVFP